MWEKEDVGELEAGAQAGVHLMLHNTEGPTCGICISIDLGRVCGTAVYPHLWPVQLCKDVAVCLAIEARFFPFLSGPSDSCDGACRRGLGHIRALFGQA